MQRSRILIFGAVLMAALAYLAVWHAADSAPGATPSGEGLMAPLDDVYIFGQYARQAVGGSYLHYTPGAELSTGVSSPTWFAALTLGLALGLPLTWTAWALGLICLAWSVHSLGRLSRRLFPRLPDYLLPLLLLAHASSVAAYFQGMDSGLLLALLWATADAALDPTDRSFWLLGACLAWTRPEGQVALPLFALARYASAPRPRLATRLGSALCMAILPTLLLLALSGNITPDSVRPKTGHLKTMPLQERLETSAQFAGGVLGRLFLGWSDPDSRVGWVGDRRSGNDPGRHFPPLALILTLTGILYAMKADSRARPWWWAWLLLWLALLLLLSIFLPVGWHRHRYLAPLWPVVILGMGAFLHAQLPANDYRRKGLLVAIAALWVVFGAVQWPWFLHATYAGAKNYALGNREAALRLAHSGLKGPIAVEDAGLIAYYGKHPIVDILGVTDHRLALLQNRGAQAVEDELRRRPPGQRPNWALLHTNRGDGYGEIWRQQGLLTKESQWGFMELDRFNWDR